MLSINDYLILNFTFLAASLKHDMVMRPEYLSNCGDTRKLP